MIGISVRFAIALGLHLRNDNAYTPQARKLLLSRIWLAITTLESLISSLTGRERLTTREQRNGAMPEMTACELENCSVHNASERGGGSSEVCPSYLGVSVAIDVIEHEVLSRLYPPRTPSQPAKTIRKATTTLLRDLDHWASAAQLPHISHTDWTRSGLTRWQSLLIFKYLRVKILICRPCLLEPQWLNEEDENLSGFILETRRLCIEAARTVADYLPDGNNIALIYQRCPFWCIVHHIMQALAVLLYELSRQDLVADDTAPNIRCIKKLCRALRAMSVSGFVARRAYDVIINLLQKGSPQLQRFATEIMSEDGAPGAFVPDSRTMQVPMPQAQPILSATDSAAFDFGADALQTLDQYQQPLYPGPGSHQWPADYSYLGEDTHMDD